MAIKCDLRQPSGSGFFSGCPRLYPQSENLLFMWTGDSECVSAAVTRWYVQALALHSKTLWKLFEVSSSGICVCYFLPWIVKCHLSHSRSINPGQLNWTYRSVIGQSNILFPQADKWYLWTHEPLKTHLKVRLNIVALWASCDWTSE